MSGPGRRQLWAPDSVDDLEPCFDRVLRLMLGLRSGGKSITEGKYNETCDCAGEVLGAVADYLEAQEFYHAANEVRYLRSLGPGGIDTEADGQQPTIGEIIRDEALASVEFETTEYRLRERAK